MDSREIVEITVKLISDKKGYDIVALDVARTSSLTDHVIIATGMNAPHLKALVNTVVSELKARGACCWHKTGDPQSGWIVVDYIDVMIHLFMPERREYYNLDRFFEEASKVVAEPDAI